MHPWERRLTDLWVLLERCHATYMEPELFRLNTNQFLQTSRTVTFIVQKNKDSIPEFDAWYRPAVSSWAKDEIMEWAKDSRNKIEKEGDLELHSTLDLTLLFSYLPEQDLRISTGRMELLQAGTKKMVRMAQKKLPSHVIGSSAIKIERVWIANSLPGVELLKALSYVYTTLYRLCQDLASRMGNRLAASIPDPTELFAIRDIARYVCYIKLSDLKTHHQTIDRVRADKNFSPPIEMAPAVYDLREKMKSVDSIGTLHTALAEMAERLFEHDGFHVPILYLYDDDFKCVDGLGMHFNDHVEKYIFWRTVADRVTTHKATVVVTINEAWIRDMRGRDHLPLKDLPIIGERLYVNSLDNKGGHKCSSWEIVRVTQESKPTLKRLLDDEELVENIPFYFAPTLRAFGLPYPEHFDQAT